MLQIETISFQNLWYLVGLIATDGNLSKDRRHITISSKNAEHLEQIKFAMHINSKLSERTSSYTKRKDNFALQFSSVKFYQFLLSVGLATKKSLTMGKLQIPKLFFKDFLRGVIDGDGCIYKWQHPTNHCIQFSLRIVSAAPIFSHWLHGKIQELYKVSAKLYIKRQEPNILYEIKMGKKAARVILADCYYNNCLCLNRKLAQASEMLK
jgi:hypothetical protein